MENKSNPFECHICMSTPIHPVVTTCGHIYCFNCLRSWVSQNTTPICPLCRNGLDMSRIIPLYTQNSDNNGSQNEVKDERPKVERIEPNSQRRSFVIIF